MYIEHTLSDVNPKFIETCSMDKVTVYLGKYSICILKEYIFCCCWMEYYINVYLRLFYIGGDETMSLFCSEETRKLYPLS